MKLHTVRLIEDQDLRQEISAFFQKLSLKNAVIVSAVGGLKTLEVRMPDARPDQQDIMKLGESLEIVSLIGTIFSDSSMHLHISVSKEDGTVIGGHFKDGLVRKTVELNLATEENIIFDRKLDENTGFRELIVKEER